MPSSRPTISRILRAKVSRSAVLSWSAVAGSSTLSAAFCTGREGPPSIALEGAVNHLDHLGRADRPADAPAGVAKALRQAVDEDVRLSVDVADMRGG